MGRTTAGRGALKKGIYAAKKAARLGRPFRCKGGGAGGGPSPIFKKAVAMGGVIVYNESE